MNIVSRKKYIGMFFHRDLSHGTGNVPSCNPASYGPRRVESLQKENVTGAQRAAKISYMENDGLNCRELLTVHILWS